MDNTEQATDPSDNLNRPIHYTELDNSLWNDKCDYVKTDGVSNLNPHNYNLAVLQLNIRSLIAHQHELILLLNSLTKLNTGIDTVLLCETFLMKNTVNMVNIPGYTHIFNHQKTTEEVGYPSF